MSQSFSLAETPPAGELAAPPSEPFFPNQPAAVLQIEEVYRREVGKLPEPSRLILYEILSLCLATLTQTSFKLTDGMVIAQQNGREIAFSSPLPLIKLSHIVFGYEQWLQRKYCLPGFVAVEPGDIVVDCGAFVGGFSLSASRIAAEVHAFEPERANFRCLQRNFAMAPNVHLNARGLYSHSGFVNLNVSASSVEHSLLMPDDGQVASLQQIELVTLREYASARQLPRLDFVKIEAEGVELEVFDGLGDLRPRKLAIDVSPERNGQSPAGEFLARLVPLGYEVRQRGHVMFGRLRA